MPKSACACKFHGKAWSKMFRKMEVLQDYISVVRVGVPWWEWCKYINITNLQISMEYMDLHGDLQQYTFRLTKDSCTELCVSRSLNCFRPEISWKLIVGCTRQVLAFAFRYRLWVTWVIYLICVPTHLKVFGTSCCPPLSSKSLPKSITPCAFTLSLSAHQKNNYYPSSLNRVCAV